MKKMMTNNQNFEITGTELFRHPKFGNLRVLTDEQGEPWFVGKVVAEALGYAKPSNALSTHVLHEDRKTLKYRNYPKTGQLNSIWKGQDTTDKVLINESGLYSLILGSTLPSAIEFKHWVTSEVLPQIRRTGGYIPTHDGQGKPLSDLEIMSLAFKIQERTIKERDRKIAEQDEAIQAMQPKASYCDEVLESVNCMTMTQVAKEHGLSNHELTQLLKDRGVIFNQWMLYADYSGHDLTCNRTHAYLDRVGKTHTNSYLVWTEKGRMFVDGILRRGLTPKQSLRQVEQPAPQHGKTIVQLEISFNG